NRVAALYNAAVGPADSGNALAAFEETLAEDSTYRASERRTSDATFWRAAFTPPPAISGMASGAAITAHDVHRVEIEAPTAISHGIRELANSQRLPWPDVLTTLVALYCQRMTGRDNTVVGVPCMGRFGNRSARVPAMVMNVLPVPLQLDENRPLTDLCRDVAKQLQQARRHRRYRSEQLRRDLGLLGGERRLYGPLINVLPFAHQPNFAGLEASVVVLATGPVDDITFTFRGDINHGLTLEVEANPALYGRAEA